MGEQPKNGRPTKKDRSSPLTGERAIKKAERAANFMDMRKQGWSLSAIGKTEDPPISAVRVHTIIKEELRKRIQEPLEAIRELENDRLDDLLTGIYEKAVNGDLFCIDRVLAIMNRRATLLGINMQVKSAEGSGPGSELGAHDGKFVVVIKNDPGDTDMKDPARQVKVEPTFEKPQDDL